MDIPISQISNTRPGIDLQSREIQVDPFPTYRMLREKFPVCQLEPDGIWAISKYSDVISVLKNTQIFSSAAFKTLYEAEWLRPDCRRDHSILSQDPPEHTKNRSIINKAFVHRVIDALIPDMRRSAAELVQTLKSRRHVEFIKDFADPYIAKFSGKITGTDAYRDSNDIRRLIELTQVINAHEPSAEHKAALEEATLQQREHFIRAIERRRRNPENDVISAAIQAEIDGVRLDNNQMVSLLDLLLHAGFMTVTNSLSHSIIQLARRPELLKRLKHQPALIPAFIEEGLRFEPPSHNLLRQTTEAVTISGVTIPADALVFALVASANRDDTQFCNPEEFDIDRPNLREHIAFGYGPHLCLGSALARLEMKIALEEIIAEFSVIDCPPDDQLPWAGALLVHAVTELPATFR